ncbi:MAG TPA: hypothetical protein VJ020_06810 [Anaerolineales bacterium]|nr:hypothetical protein [Anaerolineales bacterium]
MTDQFGLATPPNPRTPTTAARWPFLNNVNNSSTIGPRSTNRAERSRGRGRRSGGRGASASAPMFTCAPDSATTVVLRSPVMILFRPTVSVEDEVREGG